MSIDLKTITPDQTFDARAMACPGPLLAVKKTIATMVVGQTLEIMSCDKGSQEDIPAWCKKAGHDYLGCVERDSYDSLYVIRKK